MQSRSVNAILWIVSADNYIEIREDKNGEYDVFERFYEGELIEEVGHFKNLRDALVAAEKFTDEQEYGVEYGIRFCPYD